MSEETKIEGTNQELLLLMFKGMKQDIIDAVNVAFKQLQEAVAADLTAQNERIAKLEPKPELAIVADPEASATTE